ncbi:MAG: NAD-dependent epimerase/dehydratase family protein [Patescibacteria group bacterium]
MKSLAIIGSGGMLGSDLVRYLDSHFHITPIHRKNYKSVIGKMFDIVINANGNSRRYWANENPNQDFFASTVSVMQSIHDFPCNLYIYISSPDVYKTHWGSKEGEVIDSTKLEPYGFHKYLSELIVKKYTKYYLILRCSMILGSNLRKGPIFDIAHNIPLSITLDSRLQLITTRAVSDIIRTMLDNTASRNTFNVGGIGSVSFTRIGTYFNQKIQTKRDAKKQRYEMNIEKVRGLYPELATSQEYLQEFMQ